MAKEINEKTFELNITSELLNLSKSFIWYMDYSPVKDLISSKVWLEFFNQPCLYATGLTQQEESNTEKGGYDVSINYSLPNGKEARIMFLQYKAGRHVTYSKLKGSQFEKSKGKDTEHVCFTFNDAAKNTQHSTLRKLATSLGETSKSVLYVFPRITKKQDFISKVGQLIHNTSFVPVLEIDAQGAKQIPEIVIKDENEHKFRTSYDGRKSEVNLLLLLLLLDQGIVFNILTELICIQVERFFNILKMKDNSNLTPWIDIVSTSINRFVSAELRFDTTPINEYLNIVRTDLEKDNFIAHAPSRFTSIIPKEGLKLNFESRNDFSSIKYQIL